MNSLSHRLSGAFEAEVFSFFSGQKGNGMGHYQDFCRNFADSIFKIPADLLKAIRTLPSWQTFKQIEKVSIVQGLGLHAVMVDLLWM